MNRRLAAWLAVFVVATSAFVFGAVDEGTPRTDADRAYSLAKDFACPQCQGQSVAESDVVVARTIRQQIATWVLLWFFGVLGLHFNRLSFVPPPEFDARIGVDILPLTALYVAMLSSTNYCLRHVDISFYQILRSLVIPFNIVTSYLCLGFVPRPRTVGCCSVVMCGFVIGSMSELNFTYQGFTAGCLASLFMAMYSTYVKKVLPWARAIPRRKQQDGTGHSRPWS